MRRYGRFWFATVFDDDFAHDAPFFAPDPAMAVPAVGFISNHTAKIGGNNHVCGILIHPNSCDGIAAFDEP